MSFQMSVCLADQYIDRNIQKPVLLSVTMKSCRLALEKKVRKVAAKCDWGILEPDSHCSEFGYSPLVQ